MAYPEVIELFDSGSGGLTTNDKGGLEREVTLRWLVSQKANYLAAEQWAVANAPLYWSGHKRARLDIRGLGNYWWEISAQYVNLSIESDEEEPDPQSQDSGSGCQGVSTSISFDTSSGTAHITQANKTNTAGLAGATGQAKYAKAGETAPDTEGAIDIEGDQVRGVDVTVPAFTFSETWTFPAACVVESYLETLYELSGKINNAPWRMFGKGEVLFLGARGQAERGATTCQVTFSFSASPNKTGIQIGAITGIDKGGWDYLTVTYDTVAAAGSLIKRPRYVYVSSVYEGADFSRLAIGGTQFPSVYQPKKNFEAK
jgi:hypothetical protein